jgi:hypothetical protein
MSVDGGPTRRTVRLRRAALFGLLIVLAGSAWQWSAQRADARRVQIERHAEVTLQVEAGARLFDGRAPLRGRIDGHAETMTASAVVCANCHLPGAAAAAVTTSAATLAASSTASPTAAAAVTQTAIGPVLDNGDLTRLLERRGGPPSRFDEAAFCRLLRTGEDPAGVLLPKVMPRYELDDAQCGQLWRLLARDAS